MLGGRPMALSHHQTTHDVGGQLALLAQPPEQTGKQPKQPQLDRQIQAGTPRAGR